jgi:S1-C subfamily serine protease
MENELTNLSDTLAATVERLGKSVVAVHARQRFSSSGVFWRPDVIVTAEHTIRREDEITVTLPGGKRVPATLAGSDPGTDLAVLKLSEPGGEPAVSAATVPKPGHLALSVGRSEDSGVNATLGIVSAVSGAWRTWRGGRLDHYIRLDLTLYPGSSGGAVSDTAGNVHGIASSALSRIAGVAIPSSTVHRVVEEILAKGQVSRAYLGMGLQPVELSGHHKGLIVLSLEPDGPAAKGGALIGDVVVALLGKPVSDTEDVQVALEGQRPGTQVDVAVIRGGEARQLAITLGERPRRG